MFAMSNFKVCVLHSLIFIGIYFTLYALVSTPFLLLGSLLSSVSLRTSSCSSMSKSESTLSDTEPSD